MFAKDHYWLCALLACALIAGVALAADETPPRTFEKEAQVGGAEAQPLLAQPADEPPAPVKAEPAAKKPAPKKRPSLAIFPFTVAVSDFWKYYREEDVNLLTDKFITALAGTRKFDVVERRRLAKIIDEQNLTKAGMVDPARAVQMGKLVGADYFIFGSISVFSTTIEYKKIPYTSKFQEFIIADVIVDMRLTNTRTGTIVTAEKGDINFVDKSIVDAKREVKITPRFLDDLQRIMVDQLVMKVVDAIYPVKVSASRGETVFLNRGQGGGLRPGEILKVYATGIEIRDPDTGEVLGVEESEIGEIRITEVLAKFSKAMRTKGDSEFPIGSICRRVPMPLPAPGGESGKAPVHQPNW